MPYIIYDYMYVYIYIIYWPLTSKETTRESAVVHAKQHEYGTKRINYRQGECKVTLCATEAQWKKRSLIHQSLQWRTRCQQCQQLLIASAAWVVWLSFPSDPGAEKSMSCQVSYWKPGASWLRQKVMVSDGPTLDMACVLHWRFWCNWQGATTGWKRSKLFSGTPPL